MKKSACGNRKKGEPTVRPDTFRNAFLGLLLSLVAGLLAACGGGGGANAESVAQGGLLSINAGAQREQ